jgi:hypothetical protein
MGKSQIWRKLDRSQQLKLKFRKIQPKYEMWSLKHLKFRAIKLEGCIGL